DGGRVKVDDGPLAGGGLDDAVAAGVVEQAPLAVGEPVQSEPFPLRGGGRGRGLRLRLLVALTLPPPGGVRGLQFDVALEILPRGLLGPIAALLGGFVVGRGLEGDGILVHDYLQRVVREGAILFAGCSLPLSLSTVLYHLRQ